MTLTLVADEQHRDRAWSCADWLVRTYSPAWLEFAGFERCAAALRRLEDVVDDDSFEQARRRIEIIRERVDSAWRWSPGDAAAEGACAAVSDVIRNAGCADIRDAVLEAAVFDAGGGGFPSASELGLDVVWQALGAAALRTRTGERPVTARDIARQAAGVSRGTAPMQRCAQYVAAKEAVLAALGPEFERAARPVVESLRLSAPRLLRRRADADARIRAAGGAMT